jgi:hypothetical protein
VYACGGLTIQGEFLKEPLPYDHYSDVVPAPVTPRAHVLVVDPDAGVRDVCTSLLHHLGFHALVRSEPDDLATALSRSVDVVLCDVEAYRAAPPSGSAGSSAATPPYGCW